MRCLSAAADDPWVWELIEMAPQPSRISKLHTARVRKLLRKYRIRRHSAEGTLGDLNTPPLLLANGTAEAASDVCMLLIARQLRYLAGADAKAIYETRMKLGDKAFRKAIAQHSLASQKRLSSRSDA
jgi:hypothetical protein